LRTKLSAEFQEHANDLADLLAWSDLNSEKH